MFYRFVDGGNPVLVVLEGLAGAADGVVDAVVGLVPTHVESRHVRRRKDQ